MLKKLIVSELNNQEISLRSDTGSSIRTLISFSELRFSVQFANAFFSVSNFKTKAVINNSENIPQFGTIQNVGDEGGDFIFIKRKSQK
jgi:hypothetical protein